MAAVHVSARDPRISALLSARTPLGTVIAEGNWAHRCLLDTGVDIDILVYCAPLLDEPARKLARAAERRARAAYEVSAKTYARVSRRTKPSGLASLVRLPRWHAGEAVVGGQPIDNDT